MDQSKISIRVAESEIVESPTEPVSRNRAPKCDRLRQRTMRWPMGFEDSENEANKENEDENGKKE